jgi:nucleotide-binding universal stress UspA family protein
MAMFKKVLVGVEGAATGRDALALAEKLVDPDASLTLIHVYPGLLMPSHEVTPALDVARDRVSAREVLEEVAAQAQVKVELAPVQGPSPGQVLHEEVEARHCDLLVLGSSRRGVFGRAILGDDTRASLNGAPCAVAIAPLAYAEHPKPLATVGVGYDGSAESAMALDAARELALRHGASVEALRIVSPPSYLYRGMIPGALFDIEDMIREADLEMRALEGVQGRAEYGLPGEDLATFSQSVDVLVVGSRGYGPVRRLVHGSTSNYLQRHARCALLVLPRRAEADTAGDAAEAERAKAAVEG